MLEVFRVASDALLLLLQDDGGPRVVELLERYRFNEMVEMTDLSGALTWLSLQGPEAGAVADAACRVGRLAHGEFRSVPWDDASVRVVRLDEAGVPGMHLLIRGDRAPVLREALLRLARERGGGTASLAAWHACRVEAGVPWMGAELDESVLPMEAGLLPILDLEKGCYIGQEVVSRGIVQGRTNWGLRGLRVPPAAGVVPGQDLLGLERDRPVARVRSMARVPNSRDLLALAFVHREAAGPGPLRARVEGGEVEVEVEALPFGSARRAIETGLRRETA
jgi:folate-binding protein YgfZ